MERLQSTTGFLTVIVGETGSGKSCIAKDLLDESPHWCAFDVQDEYDVPALHEMETVQDKFKVSPVYNDVEDFVKVIQHSKRYTFLIEESTGFIDNDYFRSKKGKELISCIIAKRHIQKANGGGNNYIMIFHSAKSIPAKLWTYIDFLYLFPTVEKDFEQEPALNEMHAIVKDAPMIKFKTWEISDYRILVRTNHGKKNIKYIEKHKSKIYDNSK